MGDSWAAAVGIAASPFPVIPAVLLLFTARPRVTTGAFLAGWWAGIAVAAGLAVLLSDLIEAWDQTPTWLSWVRIVLGVGLVGYGLLTWLRRDPDAPAPAWMESLDRATPVAALRLGLLLSVANPKIVLLAVAGGIGIGNAVTGVLAEVIAVAVFATLGSVTVMLPLLAHVVAGERVLSPLRAVKDWLVRNNSAVMAVVLAVIGALLVSNGVTALR